MTGIISAAVSNVGRVRDKNEDNFFINGLTLPPEAGSTGAVINETDGNGLYAVCDGMGGGTHGEIASRIAVDVLREAYSRTGDRSAHVDGIVKWYTQEANARVCAEMSVLRARNMGTTYVVSSIRDNTVRVYNLGDSRAYLLLNGGRLKKLTHDHSEIKNLLEMGVITEEAAKTHPGRHTLTQHLGIDPEVLELEPYRAPSFRFLEDDILLLCSDGLTDMLEDPYIADVLRAGSSPKDIAETLVDKALGNGGKDNVTVVVVKRSD